MQPLKLLLYLLCFTHVFIRVVYSTVCLSVYNLCCSPQSVLVKTVQLADLEEQQTAAQLPANPVCGFL